MIPYVYYELDRHMRTYMNRWFAKFATRENLSTAALIDAVVRAEAGLIDADLGSGLIKQRIARSGGGRSGGYRSLVIFRSGDRAVVVFGFPKYLKDNLDAVELRTFRAAAKIVLGLTQEQVDGEVLQERLIEVKADDQDL